jgi:glycine/D-amino acid oxidase-like deaminating enzyme
MGQACLTGSVMLTPATMEDMAAAEEYGKLSFWHETVPGTLEPGDPLPGDLDADVAIAGAGYTGLWTAYYLSRADPGMKIVICERDIAGFGASGRNGGWCVPEAGSPLGVLDQEGGPGTGEAMMREMYRAVDEIAAVAQRENIDCGYAKGGALWFASDAQQMDRLSRRFEMLSRHGLGDA